VNYLAPNLGKEGFMLMCKNFLFLFKRKARKFAKSVKSHYGKQGKAKQSKAKRIEETHRQREIEEHRILKKTRTNFHL
jgi:hypothetical protein